MNNLRKTYDKPVLKSSGLSRRNFNRLLRHIAKLKKNPTHMAGVALVEFAQDVNESMLSLGISEQDLAGRSKMSLRRIKAILEPPMKSTTRATDLSRVAKALGSEVSIRLYDKVKTFSA